MTSLSIKDLLDLALDAALLGGRRTLAYFDTDVTIEEKADATPVTIADREAEQVIRSIILKHCPTHRVLGEEHGTTDGDPDYTWIIDPIDGTKSFIHGVPLYGTIVGLLIKGVPTVGAVSLPALHELYGGATGLGATRNGRKIRASGVETLPQATLLAGSITRAMDRSDAYLRLAHQVKLNRGWGDVYGYMLVASGRAEIMLDPVISLWDIAGVAPIVREAGAFFGNWKGEETVGGPDAAAIAPNLKSVVLDTLRTEVRR
jgi:histidinol-phosphatase